MAYDEALAERVRDVLEGRPGLAERRMFGGLTFLINRHICGGVYGDELLLRLGAEGTAVALASEPHTRPMSFTGRPMRGFVLVAAPGIRTEAQLRGWVEKALAVLESEQP